MTSPSKSTILTGLISAITDADDRQAIIARAERRAAKVHGGRFDREAMDLIADHFGCDVRPASGGRIALSVQPTCQGQSGSATATTRALRALETCGWDTSRILS